VSKKAPKKPARPKSADRADTAPSSEPDDAESEQSPEVELAREAVRRAREEFHKAQDAYEEVRQRAAEGLKQVRESTVGDMVDGTIKLVRKYPGPSVIVAALLGFFLGRLFRR
jgi:ElaB/YqjD/DUF883 family membrane-anchored ribosome-binding protein